jgi:hypothetical protein
MFTPASLNIFRISTHLAICCSRSASVILPPLIPAKSCVGPPMSSVSLMPQSSNAFSVSSAVFAMLR